MTDHDSSAKTVATKRLRFTETREVIANLRVDEADLLLTEGVDSTDLADTYERIFRVAGGRLHAHSEGDLTVAEDDGDGWIGWSVPTPVDGTARPSYLWTARHFVAAARRELSVGRYREGDCPELDQVNRDLGVLEERLRVMALAVEGLGPDCRPLDGGSIDG